MKRWLANIACVWAIAAAPACTPPACAEESTNSAASVPKQAFVHPLSWTIDYATSRAEYIRRNIRDYTCRLIKRERINGDLQAYQFARVKVRSEQRRDGKVIEPMSVFMQYLAPASIKDRRVLYVDGENDGKVLVRKGGNLMKHVKLTFDPHGNAVRRESNYPITDIGFDKVVDRLIDRANNDIARDPKGENTSVSYFRNAKVGERKCTHIRVVHPEPADMDFHIASLYVDDELRVPIRLVVYGWPAKQDAKPPVLEEYVYVDLRVNVGLTDEDFSPSKLESAPSQSSTAKVSR